MVVGTESYVCDQLPKLPEEPPPIGDYANPLTNAFEQPAVVAAGAAGRAVVLTPRAMARASIVGATGSHVPRDWRMDRDSENFVEKPNLEMH